MWLWILGCVQPEPEARDTGISAEGEETGQPVDTDTGAPVAEPCPFEGSWLLMSIEGVEAEFEQGTSGANMGGTAEVCEWELLVVQEGCRRRELAVLEAQPFGAWAGWTDGAPDIEPEGCTVATAPEEIRAYPELLQDGDVLSIRYGSAIFLQESVTYRLSRNN